VFVDAQADSFNIDPSAIEAAITPRTVGIVPVHLFGRCADMTAVNAIARKFHLFVIEDAAQAIGAGHGGKAAGTMGDAAIFSFFPAKNLGALGDAGAIVTGDGALDERIRVLRSHGAKKKYHHEEVGGNFRIDTLQAAMLQIKLRHLNDWTQGRRRVAVRYHAGFEGHPDIRTPQEGGDFHVYNQYVLRLPADRRDRVREALTAAGIGSANYYPAPLHLQPCFASPGQRPADLPVAEALCGQNLALPIDPNLTDGQIDEVVATVKEAL